MNIAAGHHSAGVFMERLTRAPSLGPSFCSVVWTLEHPSGATPVFRLDLLFTFFKVLEGLFLEVLEQI